MRLGHKLVLLALAAGLLRAADTADFIYRFRLTGHATKVDWTSAPSGDWDVTVRVDPVRCVVSCEYRFKGNRPSAPFAAPPVVTLHVYSDFVSLPLQWTVDPAGSQLPSALAKARPPSSFPYVPGRRLVAPPFRAHLFVPAADGLAAYSLHFPPIVSSVNAPLRI